MKNQSFREQEIFLSESLSVVVVNGFSFQKFISLLVSGRKLRLK